VAEPEVTAAVISSGVALVGIGMSVRLARRASREAAATTRQELALRSDELKGVAHRLRAEQEATRQEQLTEILRKRIDTYPALYEIIAVYGRNWEIEGKLFDRDWAEAFLTALIDNNARNGAFFSNTIYKWYGLLRAHLEDLRRDLADGRQANEQEVAKLYNIIRGPLDSSGKQQPGLGSYIKDELGSYVLTIVSARHLYPHDQERQSEGV
jgi:hypothetical protein